MYTNIEAAKQLVKRYREITGFGCKSTCMLCQHVDRAKHETVCKDCIWYSLFPAAEDYPCTEHETYWRIEEAKNALELKQALLDRAELLGEAIYEAEQENLRICE